MPVSRSPLPDKRLRVVVLGGGGREHALAWKLSQSPDALKVFLCPGNAGASSQFDCVAVTDPNDPGQILDAVLPLQPDLVVVGPDAMLEAGVADLLKDRGITVFGPTKQAAKVEWSKLFAKEVMKSAGVPTADFLKLTDLHSLQEAIDLFGFPLVLKVNGLAAGKGVAVCSDKEEAFLFFKSNENVFAEKFVSGREVSLFAICDGKAALVLDSVCDHKRLLDNDLGPNTGGMGAYSPASWLPQEFMDEIAAKTFQPVLDELAFRQAPFTGLLFAGLMVDVANKKFSVLEFNARFGDPETQALLPRIESDLLPLLYAAARGDIQGHSVTFAKESSVNVVLASGGYPATRMNTGSSIQFNPMPENVICFTAGVAKGSKGSLVNSGGRVLSVTAIGSDVKSARIRAYEAIQAIHFEGMHYRKDIACQS